VRGAASDDEQRKANEEKDPVASDDATRLARKIEQSDANAKVAEKCDGICDGHRPDELRILPPADSVRHQG
jgi:hypothetical protein